MKALIPAPYLSLDPYDRQEEFPKDIQQLVGAARNMGYLLSPVHATEMWTRHSEDRCATWLMMESCSDAELVRILLEYATVIDGPEPTAPPPPEGYATWLDYAVDTMDTRMPYLEQFGMENPTDHTREAMRLAVRAELVQLRRLAGLEN